VQGKKSRKTREGKGRGRGTPLLDKNKPHSREREKSIISLENPCDYMNGRRRCKTRRNMVGKKGKETYKLKMGSGKEWEIANELI